MEYIIKNNKATIYIEQELYPVISIKKAIMYYLEKCCIEIKTKNNRIEVAIELMDEKLNLDMIVKDFINDCMRESLRLDIARETKNIRELIIGRALYSSCMEIDNSNVDNEENRKIEKIVDEDYDLNEIAIDWFDKNRKEEV